MESERDMGERDLVLLGASRKGVEVGVSALELFRSAHDARGPERGDLRVEDARLAQHLDAVFAV